MTFKPGNICHLEIPAPDIPRLKEFYGRVFGWTFMPFHAGYEFFDAGNIAGGLVGHAEPSEKGTVLTVMATDVETTLREAEQAGGRILQTVTDVPGDRGRYGYFADPCGNKIGVFMK